MKRFFQREDVDRRVLGAVRFVNDVDNTPVQGALEILAAPLPQGQAADPREAAPLRVLRNRFGLHVIQAAIGFERYVETFLPPPADAPLEDRIAHLRVVDPSGQFFPIDFDLRLPRSLRRNDPQNRTVFEPRQVRLLPSPAAPTADGWSVLRVLAWRLVPAPTPANPQAARSAPLRGALVRVLRDTANTPLAELQTLGRGLSEWRSRMDGSRPNSAEALVAVDHIPVTTWNANANGTVLSELQPVRIEARFDPNFDPDDPEALPDPDALEAGGAGMVSGALPVSLNLRARERRTLHLTFDMNNQLSEAQPVEV